MNISKTKVGYYYKIDKKGKKTRISENLYLKLKTRIKKCKKKIQKGDVYKKFKKDNPAT